jgi:hypothetical protein
MFSLFYEGARHAYGVAVDANGDLFASFQHTDVVLHFRKNSFSPISSPYFPSSSSPSSSQNTSNINHYSNMNNYFNGTFVQFGSATTHSPEEQGIRSILWVKKQSDNSSELWVANEDLDKVFIYDQTGKIIRSLVVKNPIGLYSNDDISVVYVSSKDSKRSKGAAVYSVKKSSLKIVSTFNIIGMKHPTGVAAVEVRQNILFIILLFIHLFILFLGYFVYCRPNEKCIDGF